MLNLSYESLLFCLFTRFLIKTTILLFHKSIITFCNPPEVLSIICIIASLYLLFCITFSQISTTISLHTSRHTRIAPPAHHKAIAIGKRYYTVHISVYVIYQMFSVHVASCYHCISLAMQIIVLL